MPGPNRNNMPAYEQTENSKSATVEAGGVCNENQEYAYLDCR